MKDTLKSGIEYSHSFIVPANKMVSALYPEAEEFGVMPEVFATGFLVGFIEWACIKALKPHLDWPTEQTVGIGININHLAATPQGLEVTAKVKLVQVDGKRLFFDIEVRDDVDLVSQGKHERVVIIKERFDARVKEKALSVKNKAVHS
jgi:fluoroacetyl-CoA thioesterase